MSGTSTPLTPLSDSAERWAALDQGNERIIDASHPLLAELVREQPRQDQQRAIASEGLPAAS
jgi:hypothetical protein